jgi:hypothetical protein
MDHKITIDDAPVRDRLRVCDLPTNAVFQREAAAWWYMRTDTDSSPAINLANGVLLKARHMTTVVDRILASHETLRIGPCLFNGTSTKARAGEDGKEAT